MRVIDLARQLGCSADWLRSLERAGKLPLAQRDLNGYRRYSPTDVARIRALLFPTGPADSVA
jgi:DNA-binding transcriptional MerR regulator